MSLRGYFLKWRDDWQQSNWYMRFLLIVVISTPFIAMLNGWWLGLGQSSRLSPGQLFAVVILLGVTFVNIRLNKKNYFIIASLLVCFLITTITEYMFTGHLFMNSIIWLSRIYMTVAVFLATLAVSTTFARSSGRLLDWTGYSGLVIVWSLIICYMLNFGYHTYSGGAGFKGLYVGQNDLTASLSMLFPIIVYRFLARKTVLNGIAIAVTAYAMVMVGTKTALGSAILTIVIFAVTWLLPWIKRRWLTGSGGSKWIWIAGAILVFIIVLTILLSSSFHKLVNHQLYFYMHSNSLLTYLLSGRGNTIPYVFHILMAYPWSILTGVGFQTGNNLMQSLAGYPIILEFDPLSVLLSSGLLCVFMLVYVFLPVLRKLWHWRKGKSKPPLWLMVSLVLGVISSFLAGHVLESALAGTYFSVIAALFVTHSDSNH